MAWDWAEVAGGDMAAGELNSVGDSADARRSSVTCICEAARSGCGLSGVGCRVSDGRENGENAASFSTTFYAINHLEKNKRQAKLPRFAHT